MSVAFIDGAEHKLPAPPLLTSNSWAPSYNGSGTIGRYGSGSVYSPIDNQPLRWSIPAAQQDPEVWIGAAVRQEISLGGSTLPLMAAYGDGLTYTQHASLYLDSSGTLSLYKGTTAGTLIASSAAGIMNLATWYYLECYLKIDDTTGAYEIRVDGVNVLSGSGVDTRNGGTSANVTSVGGGRTGGGKWSLYDDVYCVTGDGTGRSGFQNEIVIQGISPNADGTYSQLTPSTGTSHYALVDEVPFSATDYNGSATDSDMDTYDYPSLTATTGVIIGAVVHMGTMKSSAGFKRGRRVLRISGTDYFGADLPSLSGTMRYSSEVIEDSPATATAFTIAEINAMQAGFQVRPI